MDLAARDRGDAIAAVIPAENRINLAEGGTARCLAHDKVYGETVPVSIGGLVEKLNGWFDVVDELLD